jgi:hypothetical protein
VIGGCEDEEFSAASLRLWSGFRSGQFMLVISDLTVQELEGAPATVRRHLDDIPTGHLMQVCLTEKVKDQRTPILLTVWSGRALWPMRCM